MGDGLSTQTAALIVLCLAIIAFVYALVATDGHSASHRRYYSASRPLQTVDVARQLQAVSRSPFNKRKLLSRSEFRIFRIIEKEVAGARKGYRVFAQACLGEILSSPDEDAFHSINSKRVDILIVDQGGWPVAAIEYQGDGHYQGTAVQRDAIKKEALRKAGVRYIEVGPGESDDAIRTHVHLQLGWSKAVPNRDSEPAATARTGFGQQEQPVMLR